jgi:hypothetical protein
MNTQKVRDFLLTHGVPCAAAVGAGFVAYILTGGKTEYPPLASGDDDDEDLYRDDEEFQDDSEGLSSRRKRSDHHVIEEVLTKLDEQMAAFSQSSLDVIKKIDDSIVYHPPPWAAEVR